MEAGKAIYNILSTDSNVTAVTSRIYGNEARQGMVFPCVIYNVISDVGVNTKSGMGALQSRVQVDCYCEKYEDVNALAILVRTSLADKAKGTYGGVLVQTIKFDSSNDTIENEGFDGVFRVSMDFMIFYTI